MVLLLALLLLLLLSAISSPFSVFRMQQFGIVAIAARAETSKSREELLRKNVDIPHKPRTAGLCRAPAMPETFPLDCPKTVFAGAVVDESGCLVSLGLQTA